MDGRAVFRFATRVMAEATRAVLEKAGVDIADVDLVIPHQANQRIIQSSMRQLGLPDEKVFINLQNYGNTSTASIPIALCEAIEQDRLKPNDKLVMVGFGAGLTWAATAIKWVVPTEPRSAFVAGGAAQRHLRSGPHAVSLPALQPPGRRQPPLRGRRGVERGPVGTHQPVAAIATTGRIGWQPAHTRLGRWSRWMWPSSLS